MNHDLMYPQIGTLIRKRRKKLKLTQAKLAARLGLSRASVANIEIGRQKILVHHLYALAAILDLAPTDLLPPVKDLPETSDWEALPLPKDLKPQQKEQIARLVAGVRPEISQEKKVKNDKQTKR
ncbi:MAG: helix-turn-helix domain-containing protein [Methylocella sp.]